MPKKPSRTAPAARPYHHGNLREQLLDLARADLEAAGAASLSLRDLAERAGVSKTAPYRHFPDRDSLLSALMERGWRDLHASLVAAIASGTDPVEGLRAMGRAYVGFALSHRGMYRLLFSGEGKRLPAGQTCPEASDSFALLALQIQRCQEAGWRTASDGQILTLSHWSLVHGAADLALEDLVPTPPGVAAVDFWAAVVDFVEPAQAPARGVATKRKAPPRHRGPARPKG